MDPEELDESQVSPIFPCNCKEPGCCCADLVCQGGVCYRCKSGEHLIQPVPECPGCGIPVHKEGACCSKECDLKTAGVVFLPALPPCPEECTGEHCHCQSCGKTGIPLTAEGYCVDCAEPTMPDYEPPNCYTPGLGWRVV